MEVYRAGGWCCKSRTLTAPDGASYCAHGVQLDGARSPVATGTLTVLGSAELAAENTLDQPTRVAPVEKSIAATSGVFELPLDAQSFAVLRVKLTK